MMFQRWFNRRASGLACVEGAAASVLALAVLALIGFAAAGWAEPEPGALSAPKWLSLNEYRGGVNLRWFRVQGAVRYGVLRRAGEAGEFKQIGFAENPAFDDLQVEPGNSYFFRIIPYDAQGKPGPPSEDRHIFLPKEEAGVLGPPQWSASRVSAEGIFLSWSHVSPDGILAYNVYRRGKKEEALQLVTSTVDTTFLDKTVKEGKTYSYVVTALSRTLQETDYSQALDILNAPSVRASQQRSPYAAVKTLEDVIIRTEQVQAYGWEKFGFVSPVDVDYLPWANRLFVADSGTGTVTIIDNRGDVVGRLGGIGNEPGQFDRLMGITLDRVGNLYAVDSYRGQILVFDQKMQFVQEIPLRPRVEKYFGKDFYEKYPAFRFGLVDLCIGPAGLLLVSDNPSGWIYVLDPGLNLVRVIGQKGEDAGMFHYPTFLVADWQGRLLVSDSLNSRIQVLDMTGNPLAVIGDRGLGIGQFIRPKGLATDEMGNVYVVDSFLNAAQVFSKDGNYVGLLADKDGLPLDLGLPNGLVFIDPDLLAVAGKVSRTVKVIRIPVHELRETVSVVKAKVAPAQARTAQRPVPGETPPPKAPGARGESPLAPGATERR